MAPSNGYIPEWLLWLLQVAVIPASIALWEWWRARDAQREQMLRKQIEHDLGANAEIRRAYMEMVAGLQGKVIEAIQEIQRSIYDVADVMQQVEASLDAITRTLIVLDQHVQEHDRRTKKEG